MPHIYCTEFMIFNKLAIKWLYKGDLNHMEAKLYTA